MGLFREDPFQDHWEQNEKIKRSKDTFNEKILEKADSAADFLEEDANRTFKALSKPRLFWVHGRSYFSYACKARLVSNLYKFWRFDNKHM